MSYSTEELTHVKFVVDVVYEKEEQHFSEKFYVSQYMIDSHGEGVAAINLILGNNSDRIFRSDYIMNIVRIETREYQAEPKDKQH